MSARSSSGLIDTTCPWTETCVPKSSAAITVSETWPLFCRCFRRARSAFMHSMRSPSSSMRYHVATDTGRPVDVTVAMTAGFGLRRIAMAASGNEASDTASFCQDRRPSMRRAAARLELLVRAVSVMSSRRRCGRGGRPAPPAGIERVQLPEISSNQPQCSRARSATRRAQGPSPYRTHGLRAPFRRPGSPRAMPARRAVASRWCVDREFSSSVARRGRRCGQDPVAERRQLEGAPPVHQQVSLSWRRSRAREALAARLADPQPRGCLRHAPLREQRLQRARG